MGSDRWHEAQGDVTRLSQQLAEAKQALAAVTRERDEAKGVPMSTKDRTDWDTMTNQVMELIKRLQDKPHKLGYQCSPGGVLNAYREGDLMFHEAVKEIERWGERERDEVKQEAAALRVLAQDLSHYVAAEASTEPQEETT